MKYFLILTSVLMVHNVYAATEITAWCYWPSSGDSVKCLHPTATKDVQVDPGSTITCKCDNNGYITYRCNEDFSPDTDESWTYFTTESSCTPLNCAKNYFDDGLGNCVNCASATGNSKAVTSGTGAIGITSCYLPSGYSASDASGAYKYTSSCYYSE